MNDSIQNTFGSDESANSSEQAISAGEHPGDEAVSKSPEFGLLDVIEAFTAMRHEWRTQTRENRELSAAIQRATENLLRLESSRGDSTARVEQPVEQDGARELVKAIVEIDIHLSRAVDAAIKSAQASSLQDLLAQSIQEEFGNRGIISRWFCRHFFKSVLRIVATNFQENVDHSTNEGLAMVVSRVRRIMSDCDIQRTETVGQPFDAATMHAIASIESEQHPSGYVEKQITPAYFWRGELLRCADVRVAR